MPKVVLSFRLKLEAVYLYLVQATILLLPWQTRWFSEASLGGWPFEQGRWSIYASWFPLIAVIIVGWMIQRRHSLALFSCHSRENGNPGSIQTSPIKSLGLGSCLRRNDATARFLIYILFSLLTTSALAVLLSPLPFFMSGRPVVIWWMEILLLTAFTLTLWRTRFPVRLALRAFVWSLVPHACLAVWQVVGQVVVASKWLGMAAHLPVTPGTSVLEINGMRILRVYGGFPHPNIFGGWLAGGILASLFLALKTSSRHIYFFYGAVAVFFVWSLIQTYARGAWLALMCALLVFVWREFRQHRRALLGLLGIMVLGGALTFAMHPERLLSRLTATGRLEEKSLHDRQASVEAVPRLFFHHPLIGSGPNTVLPLLLSGNEKLIAPLEPPHAVPFLILMDFGLLGFIVLGYGLWRFVRALRPAIWPWAAALTIFGIFDHYPWSFWSGHALVMFFCLFPLLQTLDAEG